MLCSGSVLNYHNLCATHEKGPYAICGQRRPRSACAFAQADLGLRCPLKESMDAVVCVEEQRTSSSDCTDAHAHLDFCSTHMTEGPFSYGAHHTYPLLQLMQLYRLQTPVN